MFCVVCPHCHQMMTAPEDSVGESVACPGCKKSLQVPSNAPRLPKHLMPGGMPAAAALGHAKAAAGGAGGHVGAAVAAPPVPGSAAAVATAAPKPRSTLPLGLLAGVAAVLVLIIVGVVVIPKLGGKKAVVTKHKEIPSIRTGGGDTTPPDGPAPGDLTAAILFKAYFDNALSADERYKDKEVRFAGIVAAVGSHDSEAFVNVYGVSRGKDLTQIVRCYFTGGNRDKLKTLVPNQPIKVRGTCKGKVDGRVIVRECSFVSDE